ncbi:MAG: endonuclease/exonuclease/phosphatase family protein [Elusimicrobiota bacterium]
MRAMTMNLDFYEDKRGFWMHRRARIVEALADLSPDVCALQSVARDPFREDGRDQAAQLAQASSSAYHAYFPAGTVSGGVVEYGSGFLARTGPLRAGAIYLRGESRDQDPYARCLCYAVFNSDAGPLSVFNAHFSWIPSQAARQVKAALAYMDGFEGHCLLLGDFSASSSQEPAAEFRQAGWTDVWEELRPGEPAVLGEEEGRRDHAWVTKGLKGKLAGVRLVKAEETGARSSDRLGLSVDLSVQVEGRAPRLAAAV